MSVIPETANIISVEDSGRWRRHDYSLSKWSGMQGNCFYLTGPQATTFDGVALHLPEIALPSGVVKEQVLFVYLFLQAAIASAGGVPGVWVEGAVHEF